MTITDKYSMEMDIAKLAIAQKAVEVNAAVGVTVLKQAQDIAEASAMALLQAMPQAPSTGNLGSSVDISA